ncbi:MAG: beta-propeller domain-containing protein [Methanoregula sp.]|nr:beta-propeller domain-containing protein [Methanoregula sp.]
MVQAPAASPALGVPAPAPAIPEKIPVVSGIVTSIDQLATRDDVIAYIRSHTGTPVAGSTPTTTPVLVPAGARTFSFEVDTSTFKPDEYLVIVEAIKEEATGTALFNVVAAPSVGFAPTTVPLPIATPATLVTQVPSGGNYYITISPIGNRVVGDIFSITGVTNLPADEELLVQVYASSFKPTQKSQSGEFSGMTGTIRTSSSPPPQTLVPTIAPVHTSAPVAAPTTAASVTRDFSKTNVQVTQVDEADIIKTDGENIYVVSGNCMHILKAYPAKDAEILSTLRFSGQPRDLYINGDNVVLIATDYWTRPMVTCAPGACSRHPGSVQRTLVYVFSAKDPASPVLVRELDIDGSYTSSRMIGTQLYFISSLPVPYQPDDLELPAIHDDHGGITTPPVYAFNTTDQDFSFSTIGSLDIAAREPVSAKSFIVGTTGTVYMSPETLYIAIPDMSRYGTIASTTIYSFAIDNGKITYRAGGDVDGMLLNQYSLDEYGGNLRVATTIETATGRWSTASSSKITVLDGKLNVLGTLSDIAPGERIYAARFMGDRLYLVTFRETDPFYVIGLSDPYHPAILGELKIPGFSNYLHPYDATHIIGVGKDSRSGPVKIALFNVADVGNPVLVDSESLGASGSDSPVLYDPKAFLFDPEKDLLVLPLHLTAEYSCNAPGYGCSQPPAWGGAYVYILRPKTGFILKGKVTHYDGYSGDMAPVQRALYIEDTLYTMSDSKIVMSDLAKSLDRINEVKIR